MKEKKYRCTRKAMYLHDCPGREDLYERQGYYIAANSKEEAWQKMAIIFPKEAKIGFTVDEN